MNRDRPKAYIGIGAFNLVRAKAYGQCGGYEALRLTVLDDVKLGLLLRRAGKKTRGFLGVQITLLIPAFIVAEATLSYVGLGFSDPAASWGTMLSEASNIRTFTDFPWLLSPAAAIFLFVLGVNLAVQGRPKGLHYTSPM